MELLTSSKFKLPYLFFITDREEIKELPLGVPFIYGDESIKSDIIRILEYEILYQKAISTGLPFDFRQILLDEGYTGLQDCHYELPAYMDCISDDNIDEDILGDDYDLGKSIKEDPTLFNTFIRDSAVYVNIQKIKELNVFPLWFDKLENAIETNIHNFAVFNDYMYNKKLDGMYGGVELSSPNRNLIIIDISGSIPKAVSSTCLTLSKSLAETFYADLLITGTISTLYPYENLHELNVQTIYNENGMDNDQIYFKKLVTSEKRTYKTCIAFGDNHHPGSNYWKNAVSISDEDGKKMCLWEIDKLISFHTEGTKHIAGYARWFDPKEIEKIDNWCKYLK